MALRGNADARSMASGVSTAMICTMSGLAVSITGLYPVHYFRSRTARETELLADRFVL
jgi:biopolymer transport protein ExbB